MGITDSILSNRRFKEHTFSKHPYADMAWHCRPVGVIIVLLLGAAIPMCLKSQTPDHQTTNITTWSLISVSFLGPEKGR